MGLAYNQCYKSAYNARVFNFKQRRYFLMLLGFLGHCMYRVSQKKATIQIQISALIQTTYCSALKFINAFEHECTKTHNFIHMGHEQKLV